MMMLMAVNAADQQRFAIETQQAIGTGVFGGIVTATVLAVFFVLLNLLVDVVQTLLDPRIAR